MREILFRGKSVDDNEWVYGSFCRDATEQLHGVDTGANGFIRFYDTETKKMKMVEVQRETVGQFTGLTDKSGKKIFEDDIHEYNRCWIIKYGSFCDASILESCFGWYIVDEEGYCIRLREDESKYMNIIGNIHDKEEK